MQETTRHDHAGDHHADHHSHDGDHAAHAVTQDGTPTTVFDKKFWDERYSSAPAIWSGNPNPQLVAEVADFAPGTALDIGAGEGADALWLAQQGWSVTAVDISTVALDRAAALTTAEDRSRRVAHHVAAEPTSRNGTCRPLRTTSCPHSSCTCRRFSGARTSVIARQR